MKAVILHSIYEPVFKCNQAIKDFAEFLDMDSDQVTTIEGSWLLPNHVPCFYWNRCTPQTRLIVVTWMPKDFNFELMLNAVTKGITVERKFKMDFHIEPRFLFLTEYDPQLHGTSLTDRFLKIDCSPNIPH